MAEFTKETITTQEGDTNQDSNTPVEPKASGSQTGGYIVYFIFGILEILLAFRFVLKLAGANPSSGFVDFIYSLSRIFVLPFNGIFHTSLAQGDVTTSVFEPSTLVALIVYALVAWGIVKLIKISSGKQQTE